MNNTQINNKCEYISQYLINDKKEILIIYDEDINTISNYDFKTYKYIKADDMRLLFILSDVLKNQYSEHLKIKNLIIKDKNNDKKLTKEDEKYLIKQNINYYCNDRVTELINKVNNNKDNDNNDKYKLFKKHFNKTIKQFIKDIDKQKENIKIMIINAYKVLMFYLNIIKEDYEESADECHILDLLVVINDIIYNNIELKILLNNDF